jgi:uncharacterized metal-binding protein YceD (DUF177 family)
MVVDQTFNIRISGQRLGIHEFDFSVVDSFFSAFERSQIQVGNVSVHAEMDRKDREFDIRLSLEGWVEQSCVRCLELGRIAIAAEERLFFQLHPIDGMEETDDEIIRLPMDILELDLSQPIYEMIALCLPMRFTCETIEQNCDPEMEKLIQGESNEKMDENDIIDPRWEALKKLK